MLPEDVERYRVEERDGEMVLIPDRRRRFSGWDTQEQQDADDAHRRVERRRSRLGS